MSDVKRGLKGSGSTESVNRLAVIMLLTLSIVTLAAVQGYTGTLVDERTVDATVGSDLQITFEEEVNQSTALAILDEIYDGSKSVIATTVPSLPLKSPDGEAIQTYVILDNADDVLNWNEQSVPGEKLSPAFSRYADGGFSAGEDSAFTLDLAGSWSDRKSLDDELIPESDERSQIITMTYEELDLNIIEGGFNITQFISNQSQIEELLDSYREYMRSDLSGVDFSGQDLSNRNLSRIDFSGADLSNANLGWLQLERIIV